MPPRTMRLVDIADLLGVSYQRVQQLAKSEGFPEPVKTYGGGRYRLWATKDVRAWARSYQGGAKRWGSRS